MQQLQLEDSMPCPTQAVTEEDWATHKSVIASLYIKEDLTLDQVKRIMKLRYSFKATEKMYKTRFKRWKLKKYVSACDKEAIAGLLDVYRRKGFEAPEISLDGKRVPLHVVRRHCRRNRLFDEICEDLPWSREAKPENILLARTTGFTDRSSQHLMYPIAVAEQSCHFLSASPQRQLSLGTDLDLVQHILTLTDQYFNWHSKSNNSDKQLELAKRPSTLIAPGLVKIATHASSFWKSVIRGLDLLIADQPHRARLAFDQGCALAEVVLQEQRRCLLKLIYLLFSDDRWHRFPKWRITILIYFSDMAARVLGQNHPLSIITRLCRDPIVFLNSSQRIHELLVAIFRRYARQTAVEVGQLQHVHCDTLRMNKEYLDAEREAKRLVSVCENSQGRHGEGTRYALRRLAHIYIDQRRYKDAESVFLDVIKRARTQFGDSYTDESTIFSFQNLACLSDLDGALERAEIQWRLAYDGAVLQFGVGHYETEYCRQNLDCVRLRRGLIDPRTCVHDFLTTCALHRRPSVPVAPPLLVSNWASYSRQYIDGDL